MEMSLNEKTSAQHNISPYAVSEWLDFIERNLLLIKVKNNNSYHHLMKYGLEKHYWMEYVTLAYVNFTSDMILLTGIPDQPTTLPHHLANEKQW